MKRYLIIFYIFIICVSLVSAAPPETAPDGSISTAEYTFKVTGGAADTVVDVGFSSIPTESWNIEAIHFPDDTAPLEILIDSATGEPYAQNKDNSIFVYWRLVTTKTITLGIRLTKAMEYKPSAEATQLTDPTPLEWTLCWGLREANKPAEAGQAEAQTPLTSEMKYSAPIGPSPSFTELHTITPWASAISVAGYIPLRFKTASLKDRLTVGSYVGIVELQISVS